jgi:SlyX protein
MNAHAAGDVPTGGAPGSKVEQRFEELESRQAFLDHTLEELDAVIVRQAQEILTLQQQVSELVAKLNDLGASGEPAGPASQHEIPPHY